MALQVARERARSVDDNLRRFEGLIASVPRSAAASAPIEERVALLVQRLRKAEPETRVVIQTLGTEGGSGDRRPGAALLQPLPGLPGAGAASITVEGSYLTRAGLESFLGAGIGAGAALTSLTVQDRRFHSGFRLYGRL
jgi:hypothetical protein